MQASLAAADSWDGWHRDALTHAHATWMAQQGIISLRRELHLIDMALSLSLGEGSSWMAYRLSMLLGLGLGHTYYRFRQYVSISIVQHRESMVDTQIRYLQRECSIENRPPRQTKRIVSMMYCYLRRSTTRTSVWQSTSVGVGQIRHYVIMHSSRLRYAIRQVGKSHLKCREHPRSSNISISSAEKLQISFIDYRIKETI